MKYRTICYAISLSLWLPLAFPWKSYASNNDIQMANWLTALGKEAIPILSSWQLITPGLIPSLIALSETSKQTINSLFSPDDEPMQVLEVRHLDSITQTQDATSPLPDWQLDNNPYSLGKMLSEQKEDRHAIEKKAAILADMDRLYLSTDSVSNNTHHLFIQQTTDINQEDQQQNEDVFQLNGQEDIPEDEGVWLDCAHNDGRYLTTEDETLLYPPDQTENGHWQSVVILTVPLHQGDADDSHPRTGDDQSSRQEVAPADSTAAAEAPSTSEASSRLMGFIRSFVPASSPAETTRYHLLDEQPAEIEALKSQLANTQSDLEKRNEQYEDLCSKFENLQTQSEMDKTQLEEAQRNQRDHIDELLTKLEALEKQREYDKVWRTQATKAYEANRLQYTEDFNKITVTKCKTTNPTLLNSLTRYIQDRYNDTMKTDYLLKTDKRIAIVIAMSRVGTNIQDANIQDPKNTYVLVLHYTILSNANSILPTRAKMGTAGSQYLGIADVALSTEERSGPYPYPCNECNTNKNAIDNLMKAICIPRANVVSLPEYKPNQEL